MISASQTRFINIAKLSTMAKYAENTTLWGSSPAVNYVQILDKTMDNVVVCKCNKSDEDNPINILQFGASDIRHLIKTIAECRHFSKRKKFNIFILEQKLENVARQILLWSAIFEEDILSITEKTEVFLEIYGNSLISTKTADYLNEFSAEIIRRIADFPCEDKMASIRLADLKFSDRDRLEEIFRFYKKPTEQFDITGCWNNRLRGYAGVRYDTRKNMFDWDYHMKLKERGAGVVHKAEYMTWRETGLAFEFPGSEYTIPNKTLRSNLCTQANGKVYEQKGYWGEMMTGPFIPFGIETDDKTFYEKLNGLHVKRSLDISFHNVSSSLTELKKNASILYDVKLTFCQPNVKKMAAKPKFKRFFDMAYFGRSAIPHVDAAIAEMMKDEGVIVAETAKYLLEWNKETIDDFQRQTETILNSSGYKTLPCNPLLDHHAIFIKDGL